MGRPLHWIAFKSIVSSLCHRAGPRVFSPSATQDLDSARRYRDAAAGSASPCSLGVGVRYFMANSGTGVLHRYLRNALIYWSTPCFFPGCSSIVCLWMSACRIAPPGMGCRRGALACAGSDIALGAEIDLSIFSWVMYILGAFIVYCRRAHALYHKGTFTQAKQNLSCLRRQTNTFE